MVGPGKYRFQCDREARVACLPRRQRRDSNHLKCDSLFVMAGHSRPKDGVASARLCPGHLRLCRVNGAKTWMPGTRPGMTSFAESA
jgi:hypothetical protein